MHVVCSVLATLLLFVGTAVSKPITRSVLAQLELPSGAAKCYDRLSAARVPNSADTDFSQLTPPRFVDGISVPYRPFNERLLSNMFLASDCVVPTAVSASFYASAPSSPPPDSNSTSNAALSTASPPNPAALPVIRPASTQLLTALLNFFTHEQTLLTSEREVAGSPREPLLLTIPADDEIFAPGSTLSSVRATSSNRLGPFTNSPRTFRNAVSGFVDGDGVFGDLVKRQRLRSFVGGRLRSSEGHFLAFNNFTIGDDPDSFLLNDAGHGRVFVAGDKRSSENVQLATMHAMWFRLFNFLAEEWSASHPLASDDQIFDAAAILLAAHMQVVLYKEVLPELLGPHAPRLNRKPSLRPQEQWHGIRQDFATAAFRTIHSLPSCTVPSIDANGVLTEIPFRKSTRDIPTRFQNDGFESLIRGLLERPAEDNDRFVVPTLRNLNIPGAIQRDLVALDMMRFADIGGGSPVDIRLALNLSAPTSWANVTDDLLLQEQLQQVFGSNFSDVPALLWMMIEKDDHGSWLGPLATRVIAQQYQDLREMDPCHFEHLFPASWLAVLNEVRLVDILNVTTGVTPASGFPLRILSPGSSPLNDSRYSVDSSSVWWSPTNKPHPPSPSVRPGRPSPPALPGRSPSVVSTSTFSSTTFVAPPSVTYSTGFTPTFPAYFSVAPAPNPNANAPP